MALKCVECKTNNVKEDTLILCDECRKRLKEINVVSLKPYEVHEFSWGTAVKKRNGQWTHLFIRNKELNVEGVKIKLHDNGIEFT